MPKTDDEAAIRATLEKLWDAWARGDGDAYAACFTQDANYITFNGMQLRGRKENADLHTALFRSVLKGTKINAEISSIELLADHIALVHTKGSGRKSSLQTYVLVKSDGAWLIKFFQNTRAQPFSIWLTRWMQKRNGRGA